ncbi:class I SAM-dependent methyltransferase [Mycobacterium sp. OTB74]|uniref:class I SAM-dependent methyltransferase n=1 Tax=Mycobacterium sp. OTB74 TaxID=1853452 RepID=UPI00247406C0|nr:class I SAM-dependent methyltransferase [Mycobacterium sp. OTB74]MDH6242409.1 SAM-dependent methyltransferase [Mycobacterium sp. OTB74]
MTANENNLATFSSERVVDEYVEIFDKDRGFLNAGERAAFLRAASRTRGLPILDVGVGTGRTTALLLMASDNYVAIDYAQPMVTEFARNYPEVPCLCLDARDLSHFRGEKFGLIVFSNNAIDAVSHEDRELILSEFASVLAPGGLIVFSTMNKLGPWYEEHPFQLRRPTLPFKFSLRAAVIAFGRRLLNPIGLVRAPWNWWKGRRQVEDHGDWAMGRFSPHDFDLVIHFTTLPDLCSTLSAAGLRAEVIYTDEGQPIDPGSDGYGVGNFTVVACADQQ